MAEEQSSLRAAVNRILGAPAGGTPTADDVVSLAPKASYSQDVQTPTTTTVALSNTPFDPNAEANAANAASLAAIKTQADQLAAQVTPTTKPAFDEAGLRSSLEKAGVTGRSQDQTVALHMGALGLKPAQAAKPLPALTQQQQIDSQRNNYNRMLAEQKAMLNDPKGSYWSSAGAQRVQGQMGPPKPSAPWQAAQAYWTALAKSKQ